MFLRIGMLVFGALLWGHTARAEETTQRVFEVEPGQTIGNC